MKELRIKQTKPAVTLHNQPPDLSITDSGRNELMCLRGIDIKMRLDKVTEVTVHTLVDDLDVLVQAQEVFYANDGPPLTVEHIDRLINRLNIVRAQVQSGAPSPLLPLLAMV